MNDNKMKQLVLENPILAILRNVPTDKVLNYAGAIMEGGIRFFEVALNSKDALEQIALLKKHYGHRAHIGAGTAITVERAKAAVEAGAEFLLAPSTDEDVLAWCRDNGVSMMPGALTPSDVSKCLRYGFSVIKLFPAGDMPKNYIKSLKGPFDETDYVAIGGVNRENMADFLAQGYIGVGMGSNVIPKEMVEQNDWIGAAKNVAQTVKMLGGKV